ncbi:MAG: M2 family metallopeptidase [Sedimentisphaerales bacterium]|nr:M2 family metallopeptidase [Sedimentisphaerales bacterium]
MRYVYVTALLAAAALMSGCTEQDAETAKEAQLQTFIDKHLETVKPLAKQAALASWDAAVTGDPNAYDRSSELTLQIRNVYRDPNEFAYLKELKQSGGIDDPLLVRQLDVLYNAYLANQIDADLLKQIVELGTEIEKNFSTFRGTIDGRKVTDNEIKDILKTSTDSTAREKAWQVSKQVGPVVAADLIRLVKLRNQAATKLGFDNYHSLVLTTGEQDVNELDQIFDELKRLTDEPFAALKAELDARLAANCGIAVSELLPWHYHDPFFQETPMVYDLDLDVYYEDKDVKELAQKFYDGIGLPVESILDDSDLYEKEGKNPHAFTTDIDREGDVRILCNLKNNETWMETILHELGHAVYDKYQDSEMPYLLREPAHTFTTEAVAMFFGRLSRNPAWMQQMLGLTDVQRSEIAKVSDKYAQLKQLIFARWAMVMYDFEKQLYADPDRDLNTLWWDMVEKYQLVKRPPARNAPDWAAKIHFSIAPCYYHNYMLGELLASQLNHYIAFNVLKLDSDKDVSRVGQVKAGQFLKQKVFEVGDCYYWNEMIKRATGEPLTAKYFVAQFVK